MKVPRVILIAPLLFFLVLGVILSENIFQANKEKIDQNQFREKYQLIKAAMPLSYNNDLTEDVIETRAEGELGHAKQVFIYRARFDQQPIGVVIETQAPAGYKAAIHLAVGINLSGEIVGVKILAHQETAGIGDQIHQEKSNWLKIFDRTSLQKIEAKQWHIKKSGGHFDQLSGASISASAVVHAVAKSLVYFDREKEVIFR